MWKDLIDKFEAVIFDLDGTMIDSMGVWKDIDIEYFGKYNIPFPENYQDLIEGMSVYETAKFTKEHYGFPDSIEGMMQEWDEMAFEHYSNSIDVKAGIEEFLKFLKENNKKLGIATSNSKKLCMQILKVHDLVKYFDNIITGEECKKGKPEPDVYLDVASNLSVDPKKCLVFEDLCNGIMAGRNAGMTTVAVQDDYSKKTWEEKIELADYHIEDYREILDEIL